MNSDFHKRLFHFQAKPPADAWKEIARSLDEGAPSIADRLFHYQAYPSTGIWPKISARLGNINSSAAQTVMRRNKWPAYAAAAVLVLLAGFGIYLMAPADKTQATTTLPTAKTNSLPPSPRTATTEIPLPGPGFEADATADPVPAATAKKRNRTRQLTTRMATTERKPGPSLNASKKAVPLQEKNIVNASRADRYMIATANDGKVVRLPKKAYAAFACVEASDIACREKITSMQNKMATASLSTDFAGFLDLLNNLQDQ